MLEREKLWTSFSFSTLPAPITSCPDWSFLVNHELGSTEMLDQFRGLIGVVMITFLQNSRFESIHFSLLTRYCLVSLSQPRICGATDPPVVVPSSFVPDFFDDMGGNVFNSS
jgi:hypothetical protein